MNEDGLVRTCTVQYRLFRADLPVEDLRIYFKGLTFKSLRVPVQRLVIILPVEEQGGAHANIVTEEKGDEVITSEKIVELNEKEENEDKGDNDSVVDKEVEVQEKTGKSYWMNMYRETLLKKQKVQKTTRTVSQLRKNLSVFVMIVESFGFNQ